MYKILHIPSGSYLNMIYFCNRPESNMFSIGNTTNPSEEWSCKELTYENKYDAFDFTVRLLTKNSYFELYSNFTGNKIVREKFYDVEYEIVEV